MQRPIKTAHLTRFAFFVGAVFFCLSKAQAIEIQDASYLFAGANTYVCASTTTAPTTMGAGLSANTTGLILLNPLGSGVKLVVLETNTEFTFSPAAAAGLFLAYNLMPSTGVVNGTPGTVTTAFIGQSTGTLTNSKASCLVTTTLPSTPVFFRALGGTTGASAIGGVNLTDKEYPLGSVVVPPGGILSLGSTSAAGVIGDFVWIEVPQ
jgi:hypothetical protein